jgi:predicted transposase YbfD/YdcC
MALFGRSKEEFLRGFMRLEHGVPSHDAFSDLFNRIDPTQLGGLLLRFARDWSEGLGDGVIAIDGKALRRSFGSASQRSPLHLVQAFASHSRLVLGQVRVDGRSNEITAMPALLDLLDLRGATVTADAMHTQRSTAQAVTDRGGDHVLALKGNQGALHEDVRLYMEDPEGFDDIDVSGDGVEAGHGRIETRRAAVCRNVGWLGHHGWPGLAAVGSVTATRGTGQGTGTETRYFVMSSKLSPERLLAVVRAHWSIENSLHWVLDVTMNEDRLRNRTGNGPENLAVMRRLALNLARATPDPHTKSMRGKLKRASWDERYILKLLGAAGKVKDNTEKDKIQKR